MIRNTKRKNEVTAKVAKNFVLLIISGNALVFTGLC